VFVCSGINLFFVTLETKHSIWHKRNYSMNYNTNIIGTAQVPSSNSVRTKITRDSEWNRCIQGDSVLSQYRSS
jgi:hypothetical protein